ncbi:oligo-1,6-glucosidase [Friedmanniella endophytica]|uniref:Oligo-1,6-glucosidase n=1 Tax=Microlunatus kandeliicorticis TaxID=1759536 RepID=A0A7W3IRM3_9ACTN|nr:alpha-glucosidase [Microlunatus kandeliicorticis]MBA8793989.1 oligo-1,6-glucosidase [Microlunatus kandeliicorticis]
MTESATRADRPADAPDSSPWWRSAVVYQVYPRSFCDSNTDGMGDIPGITSKLDYLHRLGVDVVWLSPVYRSPQDDNGYDISDYTDIEPAFGTLADLDALIAGLHDRGMKLVMDLVVNHTSDEHPWFVESRSSTDNPKRDWYVWRPPREGFTGGEPGAEPTNWESAFSTSAWEWDETTGAYYLHLFTRKQPDLNWENPEVRQEVYRMMNWWVDRGIDGFRMDVINLISKPGELTDLPVPPGRRRAPSLGVVANGHRMHEFLAEMHEAVLSRRPMITVGEMPGATVEDARLVTDPRRRELDMVFTFEHVNLDSAPGGTKFDLQDLPLPVLKQNLAHWQEGLAGVGWNSLYWDNHDQPRAVSRFGDDSAEHRVASAKTLASVLHLHQGTPYVYQGEELGMTNANFSEIAQYQDVETLNYHADALSLGLEAERVMASLAARSRDNARTPMQWDDSSQAGFTGGVPWLTVNPNYTEINAAAQVDDPHSVFSHYRALIALRHENPVLVDGTFALLLPDHAQLWAFTRTLATDGGTRTVLLLANCSSAPVELPSDGLPDLAGATLLLGTHGDGGGQTLAAWESRILALA